MITKKRIFFFRMILFFAFFLPMSIASAIPFAYITNSGDNTVSVVDTDTNWIIKQVNVGNEPYGVAVSPDGKKAYVTNSGSNNISVIDSTTNVVTANLTAGDSPHGIAVNPAGTELYVTNFDDIGTQDTPGTVSVIDTITNNVTPVNVGKNPFGIVCSPDGNKVYVACPGNDVYTDNTISIIDTDTNLVKDNMHVGVHPKIITVSPDGKWLYVACLTEVVSGDPNFYVIDTDTKAVVAELIVGDRPLGVAVNPAGTRVYTVSYNAINYSNYVYVMDTASNNVIDTVNVGDTISIGAEPNPTYGISFTPDGSKIYVVDNYDNSVYVINTTTNNVASKVNVGKSPVALGQFIVPSIYSPNPALPFANFTSNITFGYAPLTVQFYDLSTNATGWNWDFGDGTNSIQQSPEHTYSTPGNYTVNLTVNNADGINLKLTTIIVSEKVIPIANFSSNVTSGYSPLSVQLNDSSSNATSLNWDFGDGENSTEQNPIHTYSKAGEYTVNLTVSNVNGTDSKTLEITVNEVSKVPPVAEFEAYPTSGSAPLSVQFRDHSQNATSRSWDFNNDGVIDANNTTPVYVYTDPGNYIVNLTVSNVYGKNSTTHELVAYETPIEGKALPTADFSATPESGNAPLTVQFNDLSTNATGWNWDFDDGTNSTQQNPIHTYSTPGNYIVILTISNANGTNSTFATITVSEKVLPVANFSSSLIWIGNPHDAWGISYVDPANSNHMVYFYRNGPQHGTDDAGKIDKALYNISTNTWSGTGTTVWETTTTGIEDRQITGGVIGNAFYGFITRYDTVNNRWQDIVIVKTTDNGSSWITIDTKIPAGNWTWFQVWGHLIQVENGVWMVPWYGKNSDTGLNYVNLLQSTDGGNSWSFGPTIALSESAQYTEADIVYIGGGRMIALFRNDKGGYLTQSHSSDNGATWMNQGSTNLGDTSHQWSPSMIYDAERCKIEVIYTKVGERGKTYYFTETSPSIVFDCPCFYPTPRVLTNASSYANNALITKIRTNKYFILWSTGFYTTNVYGGVYTNCISS